MLIIPSFEREPTITKLEPRERERVRERVREEKREGGFEYPSYPLGRYHSTVERDDHFRFEGRPSLNNDIFPFRHRVDSDLISWHTTYRTSRAKPLFHQTVLSDPSSGFVAKLESFSCLVLPADVRRTT